MMNFGNEAPVKVPLQPLYQHDGDYDKCACGKRKLHSDRHCSICREVGL